MDNPANYTRFRGWIPVISGRLSFKTIGFSAFPSRARTANISDNEHRYLICWQERDTSDVAPIYKILTKLLPFHNTGPLLFICVAKSECFASTNKEVFSGRLFIALDKSLRKPRLAEALGAYYRHLVGFRNNASKTSLAGYNDKTHENITREIQSLSAFAAEFSLTRSGITTITHNRGDIFAENAPFLPTDETEKSHLIHVLCAQQFFFLRDICHKHQHHHPKTDTISDLHKLVDDDDDLSWRLANLYSMNRKIVDLKRTPHPAVLAKARGIIAYAETFYEISKNDVLGNSSNNLPIYYFRQMKESIDSAEKTSQLEIEKRGKLSDYSTTFTFGVVGVILALIGALQVAEIPKFQKETIHPSEIVIFLASYMLSRPLSFLSIIVSACLIISKINRERDPECQPLMRESLRIMHYLDRRLLIFIYVSICITSIAAVFFLISPR